MFERYTERARRVVFFARYEASQFGSTTIESEHFLLGLIREDKNLTNRFIRSSTPMEGIRKEIAGRTGIREKISTSIDLPLSNECKHILAYANEEAELLSQRYIGTEHMLLGILREEKCIAAEILFARGLRLDTIREELARAGASQEVGSGSPSLAASNAGLSLNLDALFTALETHGFMASTGHFSNAMAASEKQDWKTAQAELQLFLETILDSIRQRLNGDEAAFPIFEGFDWRLSLRGLRTGLSAEEDWKFRWSLTLLLAELLLKRFEQRLNS